MRAACAWPSTRTMPACGPGGHPTAMAAWPMCWARRPLRRGRPRAGSARRRRTATCCCTWRTMACRCAWPTGLTTMAACTSTAPPRPIPFPVSRLPRRASICRVIMPPWATMCCAWPPTIIGLGLAAAPAMLRSMWRAARLTSASRRRSHRAWPGPRWSTCRDLGMTFTGRAAASCARWRGLPIPPLAGSCVFPVARTVAICLPMHAVFPCWRGACNCSRDR